MVAVEKMMYTPRRHCDEQAGASEEAIHSVARDGGDGSVGSLAMFWIAASRVPYALLAMTVGN